MTPSDRLKEIEEDFSGDNDRSIMNKDIEWLINRVRRLEEALRLIRTHEQDCSLDCGHPYSEIIALKALEEE